MTESSGPLEYVGFWFRVVAGLIDTVLLSIALWPLGHMLYSTVKLPSPSWDPNGPGGLDLSQLETQLETQLESQLHFSITDWLLYAVLPAVVVILFWKARQATPGKMVFGARIVDATSGLPLRLGQSCVRYVGYYVSTIFLLLGFFWIGIDPRKQGWHDKMANSIVVRRRAPPPPSPPGG